MIPSKSLHHIDYIWDVFCRRVDAAVCSAIGDHQMAEIHLNKAKDVFHGCGWMVGADVFIEGAAAEFNSEMRRYLHFYPEYIGIYESGIEWGRQENNLRCEAEEENDDSDWCGSLDALQEVAEEYDKQWADNF